MIRREVIGDATLYLGDARKMLRDLQDVTTIITDPIWPNCPKGTIAGSDDPWGLWAATCAAVPASVKRMVVVMRCDSDPRFLSLLPSRLPFFRSMQLPYVIPGYLGRVLGGDETAYWFGAPPATAAGRMIVPGRGPMVQPGGRPPNGHPMSRAQAHFDWLIEWCSDHDDVVCDPFMGSGTTGVACAKLGRRFVGIEIEPRYFDLACARIATEHRRPPLPLKTKAHPEQIEMIEARA